jgi:hypothetical protein
MRWCCRNLNCGQGARGPDREENGIAVPNTAITVGPNLDYGVDACYRHGNFTAVEIYTAIAVGLDSLYS